MERALGANLGGVRLHTDARAAGATRELGAEAFTSGRDVFFADGRSQPSSPQEQRVLAHELTHVVQQGQATTPAGPRAYTGVSRPTDAAEREADRAAGAIQAGRTVQVRERSTQVQRLLPAPIRRGLNRFAEYIPGYSLFTVIIGYNPLLGETVDRNATNLVRGLLGLAGPVGTLIFDKLHELGIIQDAFTWVKGELRRLDLSLGRIERVIREAWDEVQLRKGFEHNLDVVRRHFRRVYDDVVSFARSLVSGVMDMIRRAAVSVAEPLLAENRAWALIKKILRYDPLRDEPVEATTVEILEDFLVLIGREQELEQMRERGTLQETADWLDTQLATFLGLLAQLRGLVTDAWEAIQPQNLPNLMSNLRGLATRAFGFLEEVWDFASTVALKVVDFIKNALLGWLSEFAHEVPGFHLVTVILGRNPFTGDRVPRTAENIIRGFITLLPNGNATYQQLQESGAIGQAAARIEGALAELGISWEYVVGLFTGIWESLTIADLIDPIGAFQRIRDQFGEPISRLFAFIRVVIQEVFKLILEMMNFPSDLLGSIISNVMQAFGAIRNDPVGFLLNMLAAVKQGFSSFFDNILQHLLGGLTEWLFRGLRDAGIQPPTSITLESILNLVMQVLGLTAERIWQKLAERIGQENVDRIRGAIDRLVGIWNFVRDVQQRGVAAIWEYIQSQISNLWNMVLEQARAWIMERIINRAIRWLMSLLDPTGIMPVINSFIAFFNAVQSAIEYMRDILGIINDYVSTLAAVARGALTAGAQKLEQGLANAIPIAIGFLANQFGLSNIGEKIGEIVAGIRGLIDRALNWLMDRAQRGLQGLLRSFGLGGEEEEAVDTGQPEHDVAVIEGLAAIDSAEQQYAVNGRISREDAEAVTASVASEHPVFTSLSVVDGVDRWVYAWTASPGEEHETPSQKLESASAFEGRSITESGIADELYAAGYLRPYERQGKLVIARQQGRTDDLPKLSVDENDIIKVGPSEDEAERGEVIVELSAILSAVEPHPYLDLFRNDPTAGALRLGSSLRREALSEYRPLKTRQMRRALLELLETEEEELTEVPVGGLAELAEVERIGTLPPISASGLRSTAMSDELISWFVDLLQTGWPAGWEVHHVVPTDWGGSDSTSNYAAIPGPIHQEITTWWNRLRAEILRDAEASAARADGTTAEYRSIKFE